MPHERGMVIAQRAEPSGQENRVSARTGFLRPWLGELEAVNAIAHAFFNPPQPIDYEHCNQFLKDGVRSRLTPEEAKVRIEEARRQRSIVDRYWNSNGVRRMAALVCSHGTPAGILALAETMRPNPPIAQDELHTILCDSRDRLEKLMLRYRRDHFIPTLPSTP